MTKTTAAPKPHVWRIEHPLFEGPPLRLESLWSENVTLVFAVRWLDANLPHPSGDTWLVEKNNFTLTDEGEVEEEVAE